jgi:hypothetical protein
MIRGRRPYRPGVILWIAIAFAPVGALVMAGFVLAAIRGDDLNGLQSFLVSLFGLGFGAGWLYWLYRLATIGIYVAPGVASIRGPLSTQVLPFSDIRSVEVGRWQPPLARRPVAAPVIHTHDGKQIVVLWLNASSMLVMAGDGPERIAAGLTAALD